MYNAEHALALLRAGCGYPAATFRDSQEEAIRYIVNGPGRLLVVQKTGWGKSIVYFIATRLLREQASGVTLLISPLLSLMRNQIAAAERMGLRACTINSSNRDDWPAAQVAIGRNEVDILLISPERLANQEFLSEVLAPVAGRIALLVVDEAHCISDWGHDFRPHYRLIERMIRTLPPNLRVLATTATANQRVMDDLVSVFGSQLVTLRGDLNRPSLTLQTIRLRSQAERLAWLAEQLERLPGHGIIYTLTVHDAEQVAGWLQSRGFDVRAYTGRMGDERVALEDDLLNNRVKALVATTALGMGFDKPDLAFVIHYQMPGSVVAYYQQVGRAGRALDAAYGILLSGEEDNAITDYFIRTAFPSREEVRQVITALESAPYGLSVPELLGRVNIRAGRVESTIALLSLESPSPIAKQDTRWKLTAAHLSETFWQRAERLTALRQDEKLQMQEYISLESGHMEYLVRALDGDAGEVTPPRLPLLPTTPGATTVQHAASFLQRSSIPIEPRLKWPNGGLQQYGVKGQIGSEHRACPGRALCMWGDGGRGELVRNGKYRDGHFTDELVDACASLVRQWSPRPAPTWVTCIPSLRHPHLVPNFAQRVAAILSLPFRSVFVVTGIRPQQKEMNNGVQQARNLDGVFKVQGMGQMNGPVLLIDDMVDSRWTMTVAAWLLRSHGSGDVFPLALAFTGHNS